MSTGRGHGAEKWISTLSRIWTSTFESRHLDTQSQFLGFTTASGTHLGLSELVISCYSDVMTSYYDATTSPGDY